MHSPRPRSRLTERLEGPPGSDPPAGVFDRARRRSSERGSGPLVPTEVLRLDGHDRITMPCPHVERGERELADRGLRVGDDLPVPRPRLESAPNQVHGHVCQGFSRFRVTSFRFESSCSRSECADRFENLVDRCASTISPSDPGAVHVEEPAANARACARVSLTRRGRCTTQDIPSTSRSECAPVCRASAANRAARRSPERSPRELNDLDSDSRSSPSNPTTST